MNPAPGQPLTAERLAEIEARVPAGDHPWRIEPRVVAWNGGQDEREEGFEIWTATADGEWVVAEVHDEWAADEDDDGDDGTRVVQIDATHDVHPDAASIAQFILHSRQDVPELLAEVKRLHRIINNVTVDLNDDRFPLGHRIEKASSHLLECPEAVFGEFPHGPDAAVKAAAQARCEHTFPSAGDGETPGDCSSCGMTYQQYDAGMGERIADALEAGA